MQMTVYQLAAKANGFGGREMIQPADAHGGNVDTVDVFGFQPVAKYPLGHGASADVADADHEYVPDHYRFSGSQLVVVK